MKIIFYFLFFRYILSNCFDFSSLTFFIPICPKTLDLFLNSFLCSYKLYVNVPTSSLSVLVDIEEKQNTTFMNILNMKLAGLNYTIFYGDKPTFNLTAHDRSQMYMFWADNFTAAEYVAFVDTDTLFTTKLYYSDIFIDGKPRISAFFKDPTLDHFWNEVSVTTEQAIGKVQPLHSMSYFPVLIRLNDLKKIRQHVQLVQNEKNFDSAMDKLIKPLLKVRKHNGPSFSQFHIMTSYLWYHLKNDYFWDIVPLIDLNDLRKPILKKIYSEGGFSKTDFVNYLPRVAVHSKYENIMPLSMIKKYSLCFSLKNEPLIENYNFCKNIDLNSQNVLLWCFETATSKLNNFSFLNGTFVLEQKRNENAKKCQNITWDLHEINNFLKN